jgi:gliding motility-associated-like protein
MKNITLAITLLFTAIVSAQTVNIADQGTVSTCSGIFVDSGGTSGEYQNNENYTITICPETQDVGDYIQLAFTSFNIEGEPWDFMTIHEGTDASGAIIAQLGDIVPSEISNCSSPGETYTASSDTTGCITIVFESDSSVQDPGWEAVISCVTTAGGETLPDGVEPPENAVCDGSDPFCASDGDLEFPNVSDADCVDDAPSVVTDNSCLYSAPNPSWYFIQVQDAGDMIFQITQTTGTGGTGNQLDVDYVVWGPFADTDEVCTAFEDGDCNGDHDCTGSIIDCSYSASYTETATVPNAEAGAFYLFLITNYSGDAGYITLSQTNAGVAGAGSTDCTIVCPVSSSTDASCGEANGSLIIEGLEASTAYELGYTLDGSLVATSSYTTNVDGNIVLENMNGGTYANITINVDGCEDVMADVVIGDTIPAELISFEGNGPLCAGGDPVFTIVGTANAIVTYSVDGGTDQTLTLDADGNGSNTILGTTRDVVITLSNITIGSCSTDLTDSVSISQCIIPSGISPNNDGMNDCLDISFLNATKLTIYNRYGSIVYEKGDYRDEWCGTSNDGNELPTGTYYYIVTLPSENPKKGWIYINK